MSDVYNATCIARETINEYLFVIRIKADDGAIPFEAGQYATLGMLAKELRHAGAEPDPEPLEPDHLIKRPYSIASGSAQENYLEFIVTYVPEGEQTPRLFELEIGDRLFLAPRAKGMFKLDRSPPAKDIVMVATGTGIAPFISFVRSHLTNDESRKWVLLHGARFSWDLGYKQELELAERLCPNFHYLTSITRREADPYFDGLVGRIPALLQQNIVEDQTGVSLDPEKTDFFLCGNPQMIIDLIEQLSVKGYEEGRGRKVGTIHTEKYW
jgi:ferredoxin--NADP+ reductase